MWQIICGLRKWSILHEPRLFKTPFTSRYWELATLPFKDFHLFPVYSSFQSFPFGCPLPRYASWIMAPFPCERRGVYEFTPLSILISIRSRSWFSEPRLASWLCWRVFKNPQSLWTMWLRSMNGASGPYVHPCLSFSISSAVCLCHLAQCMRWNTKQQRGIVEQKSLKGFMVKRGGGGRWGGVALSLGSAVSC